MNEYETLPTGTHATVLGGRDVVTGEPLSYPVVWADRSCDTCPRCGQPVDVVPDCPVILNEGAGQGGRIEECDQQHGCGEWLSVSWRDLPSDASDAAVIAAAGELAAERTSEIAEQRKKIETDLRRGLSAALARLAQPLDVDETAEERAEEVTTGDESRPGIYRDADGWIAWAYGPINDGDLVEVFAADLAEAAGTGGWTAHTSTGA